jgi:hypothetical protein
MATEESEYRDLLAAVERHLADGFGLYERVRRLGSLPETLQSRVLALFRPPTGNNAERPLAPYAEIAPHAAFGFEEGLAGTLAWRPRVSPAGFADEFGAALEIELVATGGSRWFTLELAAPWWEIRTARTLSVAAGARHDQDLYASIEIFVWDRGGTRHTIASRAFLLESAAPILQLDLPIAIPDEIVLDEEREPKVVLFLPREPHRLTLDHLWLRLH